MFLAIFVNFHFLNKIDYNTSTKTKKNQCTSHNKKIVKKNALELEFKTSLNKRRIGTGKQTFRLRYILYTRKICNEWPGWLLRSAGIRSWPEILLSRNGTQRFYCVGEGRGAKGRWKEGAMKRVP